ncbi:MAG: hypothetical protein J0I06_01445 [Planctomycetes bacterium]|nr:hypothetical protein [Planctomycetota bacterium]
MRTACVVFLGLCVVGLVGGCKKRPAPAEPDEGKDNTGPAVTVTPDPPPAAGKQKPFTIGKGTTLVTGPVDPAGYIDYAAALNERLSKGVTPATNANVAIWRVFGPTAPTVPTRRQDPAGEKPPAGFFDKLGTAEPPATGDYFVGIRAYCDRGAPNQEYSLKELTQRLSVRPWKVTDYKQLAEWITANEKPLAALREAVKLPRYYNPLIPVRGAKGESKGLLSAPLPGAQACRDEVAPCFACRAMVLLDQNRPEEAWQDLLACHRLGRLIGRGGTVAEGIAGMVIELLACRAEAAYLDRAKLDAKGVERCLRDLLSLPPLPPIADKFDLGERFMFLDHVMQTSRQGVWFLERSLGWQNFPNPLPYGPFEGVDWDPALESANRWYDRLTAAACEPSRAARAQKFAEYTADFKAVRGRAPDTTRLAKTLRDPAVTPRAKGEALGDLLLSLKLLSAGDKVLEAGERAQQHFDTTTVAFAVTWYQRFNGKYPARLAELVPTYLLRVPPDVFTGGELIYRPDANGFVLYGVGANGRDDGGQGQDSKPPGDDIVVRVPMPPRP